MVRKVFGLQYLIFIHFEVQIWDPKLDTAIHQQKGIVSTCDDFFLLQFDNTWLSTQTVEEMEVKVDVPALAMEEVCSFRLK